MRILVACEYSGRVRDAMIARGHDALSCDVVPSRTPGPHYQGDVMDVLYDGWDMMIAFPPCTYLSNIGAGRWHLVKEEQQAAMQFARRLWCASIDKIAIENPRGRMTEALGRKADQEINPWWFGEPWAKRTGLWLKGLPLLVATHDKPDDVQPWIGGQRSAGGGFPATGRTTRTTGATRSLVSPTRWPTRGDRPQCRRTLKTLPRAW